MTSFAERLRALREARSLTQEELAERAGITVKAVGALERGERRRPYPHTVRSLADALGLDDAGRAALVASVPGRGAAPTAPVPAPSAHTAGTPLVGRDALLEELLGLLRSGRHPLVTLVGPGGVGKTTLASAVARALSEALPGGAVVVDLVAVTDPSAVVPAVGRALGVPEDATTAAALAPYLTGRRLLLVLDNLEQVLEVAGELALLVSLCPELTVLATSRAPLRVRAEHALPVPPLTAAETRTLFLDRARAGGVWFAPEDDAAVDELCRRLDGLPLAVELAASAARLLGPASLRDRLGALPGSGPRDLPARQRTMAATLDWSLDLLGDPARALLARLSVVPNGFSLDGADAVGGGDGLPALLELVEHSLVTRTADVRGTERFRLLEPVRQYAAARLDPHEAAEAERGLAAYVVATVAGLVEDLHGSALTAALDLLDADHASVAAAFRRLEVDGRHDVAGELAGQLWLHLALRGHAREGLTWYDRLEPLPMGDRSRAAWRTGRAGLRYLLGDVAGVRADTDAALTVLARPELAGEDRLATETGVLAASGALFAGDLAAASAHLETAAARNRVAGDRWAQAHLEITAGQVALLRGELDEAERLFTAAVAAARGLGNAFTLSTALNLSATLTELREQHATSAVLLAEAAAVSVGAGLRWTFAYVLPALAGVAVRLGEPAVGARLFGASASYSDQHAVATSFQTTEALANRDLARAREVLGQAAFDAAWDAGRDSTPEDVVELARVLSARAPG